MAVNDTKIVYSRQEDIKEVLRLVMVKIGLRSNNWPEAEEKEVLLNHIITHYGGHTPKEILLAFEMGIADQLEFNEGESIVCYENFSCQYFSSVMNAYRRWAKEAYKMNVKEVPQIEAPKEDLSDKAMQDWYTSVKEKLLAGMNYSFLPVMLYDWLDKKGKVGLDNATKYRYMDAAAQELIENGELPEVEKVKNLAKRMVLNDIILKEK